MMQFFSAILRDNPLPQVGDAKLQTIFTFIYVVLGALATLMVSWSAVQFITSQGNGEKVATAKRNILYTIVGLVVVIFAGQIVVFLVGRL